MLPTAQPPALIEPATPADLQFVLALQRKHSNALGFLPTPAIEWYLSARRVRLAMENGEPAGYLLGRSHFRWEPMLRPITQAAVAMDAQRRHVGLSLVAGVVEEAALAGQVGVQAMCAADLESVHFWKAAGFLQIGAYAPNNTRGREMICFRKLLTKRVPLWFAHLPPIAGWKGRKVKR
jgi:N-acetylglutamate synthase-like GNAT family acetyltransferase